MKFRIASAKLNFRVVDNAPSFTRSLLLYRVSSKRPRRNEKIRRNKKSCNLETFNFKQRSLPLEELSKCWPSRPKTFQLP